MRPSLRCRWQSRRLVGVEAWTALSQEKASLSPGTSQSVAPPTRKSGQPPQVGPQLGRAASPPPCDATAVTQPHPPLRAAELPQQPCWRTDLAAARAKTFLAWRRASLTQDCDTLHVSDLSLVYYMLKSATTPVKGGSQVRAAAMAMPLPPPPWLEGPSHDWQQSAKIG